MIKVVRSKDCGSSPKNKVVEDLSIALVMGEHRSVASFFSEDIEWMKSDKDFFRGQDEFFQELKSTKTRDLKELGIQHVMSHGKSGAANGVLTKQDGTQIHFCHVLEFTSASAKVVKKILTYTMK